MLKIKNGYRPTFNVLVTDVYKDLITRCWSQDQDKRPIFDQILIELRTNHEYITSTVNEDEYLKYIKYIDEYKTTFDSSKADILSSLSNYKASLLNQMKNADQNQNKFIKNFFIRHFPYKYLKLLSDKSQKIVEIAEKGDIDKQFEVGVNLIERRYDFPIDTKIGLDFLKRSINKGNKASLFYYINMLIKGKLIPENHKKARKLIETHLLNDKSNQAYFYGKIFKKEKRYSESAEYFKQSINMNNSESIYEYAELLRKKLYQPTEEEKEEEFTEFYKKSISLKNTNSLYKYGLQLIKENKISEGLELIKQASDCGNSKAMYYYATILEEKEAKTINLDDQISTQNIMERQSMKYFKQSADAGYIKSMNKYGISLLKYLQSQPNYENKEEPLRYTFLEKRTFFTHFWNYVI